MKLACNTIREIIGEIKRTTAKLYADTINRSRGGCSATTELKERRIDSAEQLAQSDMEEGGYLRRG
jgi:hypothetical protein